MESMTDLMRAMAELAIQVDSLRKMLDEIRDQRDMYRDELERQYHAWSRDDLEDWADKKRILITDDMWKDWCNVWMNAYNVQADQACMLMAMDDWWKSRSRPK
jgi:hypothetical protein